MKSRPAPNLLLTRNRLHPALGGGSGMASPEVARFISGFALLSFLAPGTGGASAVNGGSDPWSTSTAHTYRGRVRAAAPRRGKRTAGCRPGPTGSGKHRHVSRTVSRTTHWVIGGWCLACQSHGAVIAGWCRAARRPRARRCGDRHDGQLLDRHADPIRQEADRV